MTQEFKGKGENNFILLQERAGDYVGAAEALLQSWQADSLEKPHLFPIAHLLGFGIELSLKGLISIGHIGTDNNLPLEHDLAKLIDAVHEFEIDLGLSDEDREIIAALNVFYSRPYIIRYPKISRLGFPDLLAVARVAKCLCQSLDALARRQDLNNADVRKRLGCDT